MSQGDPAPHHTNPYPAPYSPPSIPNPQGSNMQYPSYPEGPPQHAQHPQQSQGPPPPNIPFYQPYPMQAPPDPNAPVRYPLPPNPDGRIMSGGRHKKEIKRRTKTGCLTCRKRRIKCDEGHPACRNCQKSKRECLGYDPIFKPQPGPPPLQPASQQYPPMSHTPPVPYPPPPPQGYSPASYGAPIIEADVPTSAPDTAIDPALNIPTQDPGSTEEATGGQAGLQSRRAKRTKIEDLLCINGVSPPAPAPPGQLAESGKGEIRHIYSTAYAPGMDKFLETRWFGERGINHLMENSVLCDQFQMLIQRYAMNPQDPHYYVHLGITQSLEAMVVWSMLGMCKKAAHTRNEAGQVNEDDLKEGVLDASKRLEIFEALVTGEYLSTASAPQDSEPTANGLAHQLKSREHEFWRSVHTFLTLRDDQPGSVKGIEDALSTCRGRLETKENRDVIYSIMIVRHIGASAVETKQPQTNDEKDINAKLAVAKRLVEDEAAGKGTNQVVQRLCGVAARSWALKQ